MREIIIIKEVDVGVTGYQEGKRVGSNFDIHDCSSFAFGAASA